MVGVTPEVSADSLDKDVEIHSLHSPSSTTIHSQDGERDVEKGDVGSVPETQDIEEYPESNVCYGEEGDRKRKGRNLTNVISRIGTKSSWKDPGPPPDGGWSGWTQGMLTLFRSSLYLGIPETKDWSPSTPSPRRGRGSRKYSSSSTKSNPAQANMP